MAAGEYAKQIAIVIDGSIAFFIGVKEEIANKLINATDFFECESVNGFFVFLYFILEEQTKFYVMK